MTFVDFIKELFKNRVLLSALLAWGIAQALKTLIHGVINHEWRLERMWGSGGMPSSHAATVCALVVAVAYNFGPASFEFAIAFLFATIVLHDARGVRLETGKQAEIINSIMRFLRMEDTKIDLPEIELKELIGHTPLQVGAGMVIGLVTGLLFH